MASCFIHLALGFLIFWKASFHGNYNIYSVNKHYIITLGAYSIDQALTVKKLLTKMPCAITGSCYDIGCCLWFYSVSLVFSQTVCCFSNKYSRRIFAHFWLDLIVFSEFNLNLLLTIPSSDVYVKRLLLPAAILKIQYKQIKGSNSCSDYVGNVCGFQMTAIN